MKLGWKAGALCTMGLALQAHAGELPNTEDLQGMQFNFSTPGARSLAMGGAFLARADDATAAFTNPAGLTNLFGSEISAEYRDNDFSSQHTAGGRYPNVDLADASSGTSGLSFASYVNPGEKWVFALYYHQLMDFETNFDVGKIFYPDFFDDSVFAFPTQNMLDVDISSFGVSTAFRLSDAVSLGVGLSYYQFDMNGVTTRFNDTPPSSVNNVQEQSGDDEDYSFTFGATFRLSEKLALGAVYRSAPEFDAEHFLLRDGQVDYSRAFTFSVPDLWGVGLSFQPTDALTINLDMNRVSYSELTDNIFWAFSDDPTAEEANAIAKLGIDDGTQYHLGAEYVLSSLPVALRAGLWHDPAHAIDFRGPVNTLSDQVHDSFFQGTDDELHYSLGFGVFFENFQLDVAADFSDIQDTISLSGVFRFD